MIPQTKQMRQFVQYLQSPRWRYTQARKLEAVGQHCECCPETIDLRVCHRHYNTVGRERDEDLQVLCAFHRMVREVENAVDWHDADNRAQAPELVRQITADNAGVLPALDRILEEIEIRTGQVTWDRKDWGPC
jgi:hypothetical protein